MTEFEPPPQFSFTLGYSGHPDTIFLGAETAENPLTLQMTPSADIALTAGTPVPISEAGAAGGSLFYLDLSVLGIDAGDFAKLALVGTGWTSRAYPDDSMICFAPEAAMSLDASSPVSFHLTDFALQKAPSSPSTALRLDVFRAPPVARGAFPAVSSTQVAVVPAPGSKKNLHEALSADILPDESVVASVVGSPEVRNNLKLVLSPKRSGPEAVAGPDTVFVLTVVYATDANGYGALMTAAEGNAISIPPPHGGGWIPSNLDGVSGRSWLLQPKNDVQLPSSGGNAVSFDFGPVATYFQPGPTIVLLKYENVPGYEDGCFTIPLTKWPHVKIDAFTATPSITSLDTATGLATVDLAWSTSDAGTVLLDEEDVTDLTHKTVTIKQTTTFTLTAYGPGSGNVNNLAVVNRTATVVPILQSLQSAPSAISIDDFGAGSPTIRVNWAVNASRSDFFQLTSTAGFNQGGYPPATSVGVSFAKPQLFTLSIQGDANPEDAWRLYVPVFEPLKIEPANCSGAYALAAPGASFVAVSQASADQVVMLSSASYTQIASVACGTSPQGLAFAPDGKTLYVANQGDGTIGVINIATSGQAPPWTFTKGQPIAVGGAPAKVALGPSKYLYATVARGSKPGQLAMVVLSDGTVNKLTVGQDPYGLAVSPSGAQVFVGNRGDGTVTQLGISPRGIPQVIATLDGLPGAAGVAITPDGNTLLVACSDGTVVLLDATAPGTSPRTSVQVGGRPMDIALDPSGAYAWVTDNTGGKVALINVAKAAVIGMPVSVATGPLGVSVSPDGLLVFVGHAGALSVLSLQTYTLGDTPPNCGGYVTNVAVSAVGQSAFVWADASYKIKGSTAASGLHVYDVPSGTLLPYLPDTPIIDLAVASDAVDVAFLTQKGQSGVYPFDTTAFTLGTPLAIPAGDGAARRQPLKLALSDAGDRLFVLVSDGSNAFSIVVFANGADGYELNADVPVYTTTGQPLNPKLCASPDGSAAYTYDALGGNLWRIVQTAAGYVLGTSLALGVRSAAGLLVNHRGTKLYIAGQVQLTTTFFVVDCAAWTFERFVLTEPVTTLSVASMALSPDGTKILVSDPTADAIRFIDAFSIRFLQTLSQPGSCGGPAGVAMMPDQSRIFIANQTGDLITAIQLRPPVATTDIEGDQMIEEKQDALLGDTPLVNPYYIRNQMGAVPPGKNGNWTACPDIIFSTTGAPNWTPQALPDPATLLTAASYGTDYGSTVQVSTAGNINNFVYLRALNTQPNQTFTPRFWMLYTTSDMCLWPQNWVGNNIRVGQVNQNWQDGVAIESGGPGPYIATANPFLWTPVPPPNGNHYCVISMVEPFPGATVENPLSDPPFAPPQSIGYLGTWAGLAAFALSNNWFGWRNTIDVTSLGATWQQTLPLTGPDEGGAVSVGIACKTMPTDGYFSAFMQGPDANNTVNIPKSSITSPNMILTVPLTLPAKFKTNMIITYWQGSTVPPPGSTIMPATQIDSSSALLLKELRGRKILRPPTMARAHDPRTHEFQGWKKVHTFGGTPLSWSGPTPQPRGLIGFSRNLPEVNPAREGGDASRQSRSGTGSSSGGTLHLTYEPAVHDASEHVVLKMRSADAAGRTMAFPLSLAGSGDRVHVELHWRGPAYHAVTIANEPGPRSVADSAASAADKAKTPPWINLVEKVQLDPNRPPVWQRMVPVSGPVEAARALVGMRCVNMPTDGFVSLSLNPGDARIETTKISYPDMVITTLFDMPAGYQGQMTLTFWGGETPVSPITPGSDIEPVLVIAMPTREG